MGLFTNLFIRNWVESRDQRQHGVTNRFLGFIPDHGNVIVCGGSRNERSIATKIRLDTVRERLEVCAKDEIPTLCLVADRIVFEEIAQTWSTNKNICVFGKSLSYKPFDCTYSIDDVHYLFDAVIDQANVSDIECQNILHKLLDILWQNLSDEYFDWENLEMLGDRLANTRSIDEFCQYIKNQICIQASEDIRPVLNQSNGIAMFQRFWQQYTRQLRQVAAGGTPKRSLRSCIVERKTCVFYVPEMNSELLLESLFQEMAIVRANGGMVCLIDFGVSLANAKKSHLLESGNYSLISDSLSKLHISELNLCQPTYVCLGVSAGEADQIINDAVASRFLRKVTVTTGRHAGGVSIVDVAGKPIQAEELTMNQIGDGSAIMISPKGYDRVRLLF